MQGDRVERKCGSCGQWVIGQVDQCPHCGHTVNPHKRIEEEHVEREIKRQQVPKTWLDDLINKVKDSRNPFVKLVYYVLSAIWFVYWVILSFILWAIAASPG